MNYTLLALDVDGTLLNDEYQITALTKGAVQQFGQAEGRHIVLCTGRGPGNTFPIMEELELEGIMVAHNGAATIHSRTKEIIHQYSYDLAKLEPFLQYCRQQAVHYDVCSALHLYVDRSTDEADQMYMKYQIEPIRMEKVEQIQEPVVKMTLFGSMKQMDDAYDALQQIPTDLRMIRSGDYFIDIMHPEASKGAALKQTALSKGINSSEIVAFGNYYNDMDMLRFAGWGVAMYNSPQEVKEAADAVTLSNNEDGIYVTLHQLLDLS